MTCLFCSLLQKHHNTVLSFLDKKDMTLGREKTPPGLENSVFCPGLTMQHPLSTSELGKCHDLNFFYTLLRFLFDENMPVLKKDV